jgi:hypothetical protein
MSWSDSGAPAGIHEINLIVKIAAKSDDDAARRLYRKYRMELFRFGFHVLRDQGLAEEMVQESFEPFLRIVGRCRIRIGPLAELTSGLPESAWVSSPCVAMLSVTAGPLVASLVVSSQAGHPLL